MTRLFALLVALLLFEPANAAPADPGPPGPITHLEVYFKADPVPIYEILDRPNKQTGHAFVEFHGIVNGNRIDEGWGFHPADEDGVSSIPEIAVTGIDGKIKNDLSSPGQLYLKKDIYGEKLWKQLTDLRDKWNGYDIPGKEPVSYAVLGNNCVTFADAVAKTIGLNTPSDFEDFECLFCKSPGRYMEALRALNPEDAVIISSEEGGEGIVDATDWQKMNVWNTLFGENMQRKDTAKRNQQHWNAYSAKKTENYLTRFNGIESSRSAMFQEQRSKIAEQGAIQSEYNAAVRTELDAEVAKIRNGVTLPEGKGVGPYYFDFGQGADAPDDGGVGTSDPCSTGGIICLDASLPRVLISPHDAADRVSSGKAVLDAASLLADNGDRSGSSTTRSKGVDYRVGREVSSANHNRIDLGNVVPGETLSFQIEVTSGRSDTFALFVNGTSLTAKWAGSSIAELPENLKFFQAGETERIDVVFTASTSADGLQYLELLSENGNSGLLAFDYLIVPYDAVTFPLRYDGLVAGNGKAFSKPYELCIGPPPAEYALSSFSYALSGVSSHYHRDCGSWASCTVTRADSSNFCVAFQIQGHDGGVCLFCNDPGIASYVAANVALTSTYTRIRKSASISGLR
ncbi:hypothetical protein ACU8OS_15785 [Rhizobium leguminosarum]